MSTAFKWLVTGFCLVLIVAHAFVGSLFIDQITVWLLLVALLPWLIHLVDSVKLPGGGEVNFRPQSEKEKVASVEQELVAEAEPGEAATEGGPAGRVQLRAERTGYLKSEAAALAALAEQLAPGWDLLQRQVVEFPGGYEIEADGVIRGPGGWRLIVVEVKILERNRSISDAVAQLGLVVGQAVTTARVAGQAYEPMLLWVAREWSVSHMESIMKAVAPIVTTSGLHLGIYDEPADRLSFAFWRPHFVRPSAHLVIRS